MKIKKFVAPTLKEATEKMKKELGENAILLNTRSVPAAGIFAAKGKSQYEITGAVDDEPHKGARRAASASSEAEEHRLAQVGAPPSAAHERTRMDDAPLAALEHLTERFDRERTAAARGRTHGIASAVGTSSSGAQQESLQAELDELKRSLDELRQELANPGGRTLPASYKRLYAALTAQEVSEKIAMGIIEPMMNSSQGFSAPQIHERALKALAALIPASGEVKPLKRRAKIVAVVGPTGVGKTTTIAKLSAICSLVRKMKIGLISADTYRIAAIDQLQTFATIASIDMDVAYKPKDMPALLKKFSSKDIIFIDTAGRNQRNPKEIAQLEKILASAHPDEVHLVLSATSSLRTMRDVVKRFAPLAPNRIIFSKLDEASAFGNLVNVTAHTGLPVSYLTTGQQVPDDLQTADGMEVARMILDAGALPDA